MRAIRLSLMLALLTLPCAAQKINLATQVTGLLARMNGGTGTDTSNGSGISGCPKVTSGVWAWSSANCGAGSGGGITGITIATANGFQGSSSGGATPALTINVDAAHFLPVNGGSTGLYLNQFGTYTAPSSSQSFNPITCASTITISITNAVNYLPLSCNVTSVVFANGPSPNSACTKLQVAQSGGFTLTGYPSTVKNPLVPSPMAGTFDQIEYCWDPIDSVWLGLGGTTNQ